MNNARGVLSAETVGPRVLTRLSEARAGDVVRIVAVDVAADVTFRLMELGLVSGAELEVQQRGPLGGPIRLRVGGSRLSVRRHDAEAFVVERRETR